MDEFSLDDLQAALQSAQEEKSTVRLSERNVVELVSKLKGLGLLGDDLLHSINGREYLTAAHLCGEIKDAVAQAGGRIPLVDLPAQLGVDLVHCERQADVIVRKSNGGVLLEQGELITLAYFDGLAAEANEMLQEAGVIPLGDLARRFNLGADLLMSAIAPRMGTVIHGRLEGQLLYTSAYIARIKAKVRGALRAASAPVTIPNMLRELDLENLSTGSTTISAIVVELLAAGSIKGQLRGGGTTWTPAIYALSQQGAVRSFYQQNGYIGYDTVAKLGISSGRSYLETAFPDGLALDTAFVSADLLHSLEAASEDALASATFCDVGPLLPSVLTPTDVTTLLQKCSTVQTAEKAKSGPGAGSLLAGTCLVSAALLEQNSQGGGPEAASAAKLSIDALGEQILEWYPDMEEAGHRGRLAQAIASQLRPAAVAEYEKALAAVFVAGAEARRRQREALSRSLDDAYQRWQLYGHGAELLGQDEATSATLARHLIRSVGQEAVDCLLRYQQVDVQKDAGQEPADAPSSKEAATAPLTAAERSALINQLPKDTQQSSSAAVDKLNGGSTTEFQEALEHAAEDAGLRLRRLDKKAERGLVHAHRKALEAQLEAAIEPASALSLVVPMLFAKVHGSELGAPPLCDNNMFSIGRLLNFRGSKPASTAEPQKKQPGRRPTKPGGCVVGAKLLTNEPQSLVGKYVRVWDNELERYELAEVVQLTEKEVSDAEDSGIESGSGSDSDQEDEEEEVQLQRRKAGRAPTKAGGCAEGAKLSSQELVGRRVAVYWASDRRYYTGTVAVYNGKKKRHVIQYDDGDQEKLDMSTEIWRLEGLALGLGIVFAPSRRGVWHAS
ncbi:hypothetical protein WJX72_011062 [[Myrmecia] bisecta]|uniref:Tudor domain-containing protein n=1 Tax=[Myrmecia] bisecta TaxID=41462 RepID=A0AAW1Q5N1_9CHLO